MASFDFDAQRARRATLDDELVARLGGRDLRFHPMPPIVPSKAAIDRIGEAETTGDDLAVTMAVIDWLTVVVHPASADDLASVLLSTDDPISAHDLAELYLWLCGTYAERAKPAEPAPAFRLPPQADPTAPPARRTSLDQLQSITGRVGLGKVVKG